MVVLDAPGDDQPVLAGSRATENSPFRNGTGPCIRALRSRPEFGVRRSFQPNELNLAGGRRSVLLLEGKPYPRLVVHRNAFLDGLIVLDLKGKLVFPVQYPSTGHLPRANRQLDFDFPILIRVTPDGRLFEAKVDQAVDTGFRLVSVRV